MKTVKLTDLLDLAGKHATVVMTKLHQPLMPSWLLLNSEAQVIIIGTPWRDDNEKEAAARQLRKEMRKQKTVAYSFVTEAWQAYSPVGEDPNAVRASERPDKREVVIAVASDGKRNEWRTWQIQRDWNEQVRQLVQLEMPPGEPESWMANMLKKER